MVKSKTSAGKGFEDQWKESYKDTPYFYMRLRDTAKWMQGEGSSFTPSNICDSIQYAYPYIWLLELKSTNGASISFNPNTPWEKPKNQKTQVMIKYNQVRDLMKEQDKEGVIPGFILNFRPRQLKSGETGNQCYFVHVRDFVKFAVESGKSSIGENDCKSIGVEIKSKKKKVNYTYDIKKLVNDVYNKKQTNSEMNINDKNQR